MPDSKPWSVEEDRILREFYPIERGAVKQRLPGRTTGACRARASILGIAKKMEKKHVPWSDAELKILDEFYPTEGGKVSKRLPGRTESACLLQAAAQGIRFNDAWTEQEDNVLREYYPHEGRAVHRRIPGRTPSACGSRARNLGIKCLHSHPPIIKDTGEK